MFGSRPWDIGEGLFGYSWPAEHPRAMLLLQHGYGEYAGRFVEEHGGLISRLREAGLSVFAFDLPGHGGSAGNRGVVDVQQAVRWHLRAREKLQAFDLPLILMGHSLGGLVTAASVLATQKALGGVILTSPAFDRRNAATRAIVQWIARVDPECGVAFRPVPAVLSRNEAVVRRYSDDPFIYRGPLRALMAASALGAAYRVYRDASAWQVPTIILHGDNDAVTRSSTSIAIFERMSTSDKSFELVPGGRHELLNDLVSEQVMARLLEWIDARLEVLAGESTGMAP